MHKRNTLVWMLLLVGLFVAGDAAAAAEDDAIKIRKAPAEVEVKTFDPRNRPKDMPELRKDEAAVTESSFACAVQIEVESTTSGDNSIKTKIVGVRANLKLDVTVWVPKNATKKIRVHEDGHRYISEYFYQDAEQIAQKVAEKYIGKQLSVRSKDDVQPAIKKAATEFCGEFLGAVEKPSQDAQEKYDQITDHGRNRVPEQRAIKEALESVKKPEVAAAAAGAAATQPAR